MQEMKIKPFVDSAAIKQFDRFIRTMQEARNVLEEMEICIAVPTNENDPYGEVMNAEEVATYLNVVVDTVYSMSKYGDLPYFKAGSRTLFRRKSIEQWIVHQELKCLNGKSVKALA